MSASATTRTVYKQLGELDSTALVDELARQVEAVNKADLQRPEAVLIAQAHTLDAPFREMTRGAILKMAGYLGAAEAYLRFALNSQSQCRTTLETLAPIKNPTLVAIVRQANIAKGPQQVNNAPVQVPESSRAREPENQPNEPALQERDCVSLAQSSMLQSSSKADS